ncbi:MAG: flagellar filament outer layer protein FlaA [Treponemataceae bacterium]
MKHRVFFNVSLVLMLVIFCLPVIAQPSTKSVETVLIDEFDDPSANEWTWKVNASRFIAEGYPKVTYTPAIPNPLRTFRSPDAPEAKVLGVKVAFDRKGDNWFEIYPTKTGEDGKEVNYEIPLKGITSQLDFWVWGANYLYSLDVLIRDADGRVNVVPVGTLNYNGWRNQIVKIPAGIRQQSRLRSGPKNTSFVGFRIKTKPTEFVDDFVIYFDNLKYTTHTLSDIYDGFELRDLDFDSAE